MMRKLAYAIEVLRERGPGFFWTYFVESVWFDLRHGTRTSTRVAKDDQSIESSQTEQDNGLLYVASFTSVTRDTVRIARDLMGTDRFARAQFVDLGCGKGKALLVHALGDGKGQSAPALGIEYDPTLAALARQNADACGLGADRLRIVADTATNLMAHVAAETLVVYLYNSFQGETLRAVLTSLKAVPHVLIYVDPVEKGILVNYGYRIERDVAGRYNADTWVVARSAAM